jgi:hypothetical protein
MGFFRIRIISDDGVALMKQVLTHLARGEHDSIAA